MAEDILYDQEVNTGEPDPLEKLYKVVSEKGLYTKSYNDFKTKYSNQQERDKLFNVVAEQGLYTKTKDDFNKKYFSQTQPEIPKFQLQTKPGTQAQAKESTAIIPTAASMQQSQQVKGNKTTAEKFNIDAQASKKILQDELLKNDDVVENTIRQGRYLQAQEQGLTNFAQSPRSDMPQTQADIDAGRLTQPETKPQDAPVTPEDISLRKKEIQSNEAIARQHLSATAKLKPEKKAELERATYLADKSIEVEQDPTSPRASKMLANASKIAKGEYTYDIKSGQLQRPEGFLDSIITGVKERTKQIGGYNDVKNMTDQQAADYFENKRAGIDPDAAVPVPTGAGEIGQMTGQEWAPLLKGAGAAIVSSFAGNPEAAPFVNAAINAPEYYKRSYYSAFEETYNQLRGEGKSKEEAAQLARGQAETEGKLGAAEGAVSSIIGARIGLKPLPKFNLTSGLRKAVTNVLSKTAHYGGEAALEGTVDGLVAGYLQEQKNIAAKEHGIFRTEGHQIAENIKGELMFSLAMAGATGLGKAAIDPHTYKTLLYHLTKQPEASINEKLGEWVQEGRITEADAKNTKEAIQQEKQIQSQIPDNVTEEAREKIRNKIDKRTELQSKTETLDEAFKPQLKEKINAINEDILELSKDTERPTEENKLIDKGIKEGKISNVFADVAKNNPESFFKMIADQAFGRTETGEMSAEPNAEQSTRDQFGDEIVDKAKELYPLTQKTETDASAIRSDSGQVQETRNAIEGSQNQSGENLQSSEVNAPVNAETQQQVGGKEVVINTPEDFERELSKLFTDESSHTAEPATSEVGKEIPTGTDTTVEGKTVLPDTQRSVETKKPKKSVPKLSKKEQETADYAFKNSYRFFKQKYPDIDVDEYNRLRSVKSQQPLPKLGEINQQNNTRPRNEDTTQYTPKSVIEKAKAFYKNDPLINKVISFLEPIIKANPNIKIDTGFKWDSGQYEGQKITKQALGYSFPSGNLILNFDRIVDYDTLYRTALHELMHAATRNEINTNTAFNEDLKKVLADVRKAMGLPEGDSVVDALIRNNVISQDYDGKYGAANEHELLAEVFTNQKFFDYLKGLEYKGDNILHKLFLAIAKFFSSKYKSLVEAKGNISTDNIADYLQQLTESVISGEQDQTKEGNALPQMRLPEREVLKNILAKAIGKISEADIRNKLKQIANLTDQEIDDLMGEVQPPTPKAQPSKVLTPSEIGNTPTEPKRKSKLRRFGEKYFTRSKGLPDWILALKDRSRGEVHLEVRQALNLVAEVKKTAKRLGFDNWELFDKALRGQYYGSDLVDLKALPPEMQVLNVQMRNKIDSLSRDLIINNYVTPDQALNIESNIGEYMTRSYRAFNEKNWGKKVPQQARDDAFRFLTQEHFNSLMKENEDEINNGTITEDELIDQARNSAHRELQSIIDGISDKYTPTKSNVEKGKDLGVLKQRKDVPKEIRELLGEYTDPGINFAMTIARIASLKSSAEYLTNLKQQGMGEIFFEEENRPPEASVQIAPEGSETWNPLNGLYTTPEVKEIFKESEHTRNWLVRTWLKTVGAIKWSKTVGSVVTQVKNFESNLGFSIMNGHYRAGKFSESYKFLKDKLISGEKSKDQMIEKVIRLGLVDQSVGVRELRNMFEDDKLEKVIANSSISQTSSLKKIGRVAGKGINYLNKIYGASDDFWKVYGFLKEAESLSQATYNRSYKNLTEDEKTSIDTEASERIKNTYPTYDRVWEGAKYVSKNLPIFGNFLSFKAESIRVLLNTFDYAIKDMKVPERRTMAARRLAGVSAYLGARTAILYTIAQMTGVGMAGLLSMGNDDDEDQKLKDINRYSPDFIRSGDKLAKDQGDGNYMVYDVGGLEPYGIWFKTMNAYTEGNDIVKGGGIGAAASELLSPFIEPEMSFKIGLNLYNNENDFGSRIYNPMDGFGDQMLDAMTFAMQKAKPSTIDFIQRVYKQENKENEIAAAFGGRGYTVEVAKNFSFKLKAAEELFDANRDALNKIKYNPDSSEEDINNAQKTFEERTNKIIKMLSEDYHAGIRLGAPMNKLDEAIDRKKFFEGYNKDVKNQIKSGMVEEEKSTSDEIKEWQP